MRTTNEITSNKRDEDFSLYVALCTSRQKKNFTYLIYHCQMFLK